jgi:hypothetical protein
MIEEKYNFDARSAAASPPELGHRWTADQLLGDNYAIQGQLKALPATL